MKVLAVRIYDGKNNTPMADLKMADGVCETIQWDSIKQRKPFVGYITGYTLFYDERRKPAWDEL